MKYFHAIFLLVICLTLSVPIFSQNKDKKEETPLTIKTNLMVLNSKEEYADINSEDIKLLENGVEQKITNLYKKEAANIGIVIDNTGSMRFQLETILQTASLLVRNLREKDQAFTVRFVSKDKIQTAQDWTSNKSLLHGSLENMYIEGGKSAVIDAIKFSADKLIQKKDDSRRRALILISDFDDRDSDNKFNDVLKLLKDNNIEVYIIGLMEDLSVNPRGKKSMEYARILASATGGMAFFPKSTRNNQNEIAKSAQTAIFEIRSQYVIEYVSTNPNTKERKLSVQIADAADGEKRQGFIRPIVNTGEK